MSDRDAPHFDPENQQRLGAFLDATIDRGGSRPSIDTAFPFPSYRQYQREALEEASTALWENGYDTVFLQLPTGIGKSPLNVALANQSHKAFYTTPSKKLRTQLENDTDLQPEYAVLRGRADYLCGEMNREKNCEDCPINDDPDESCRDYPRCTYWTAKERAMNADIAVCTFAALLVDGRIPTYTETTDSVGRTVSEQISFDDRELLVIDEAHTLVDHVAGLWAGFTISPAATAAFPRDLYDEHLPVERLQSALDHDGPDIWLYEHLEGALSNLEQAANTRSEWITENIPTQGEIAAEPDQERAKQLENERKRLQRESAACMGVSRGIQRAQEGIDAGRPWVIDLEPRYDNGERLAAVKIRPVDVDHYLQEHLWGRTNKRVLSSATLPYPDNPARWATELGVDPETVYTVDYPMPFPAENRPVYTDTTVAGMSGGGFEANLERIAAAIRTLAEKHDGQKGLVHTVSYSRGEQLYEQLGDIAILHDRDERRRNDHINDQAFLDRWESDDGRYGNCNVLLSPALMEGVDLYDDRCRWQALVKLPNPYLGDSRVRYRAKERGDWNWYKNQAAMKTVQAIGRGVRHTDDSCSFYALDSDIYDVIPTRVPRWVNDATFL